MGNEAVRRLPEPELVYQLPSLLSETGVGYHQKHGRQQSSTVKISKQQATYCTSKSKTIVTQSGRQLGRFDGKQ